MGFDDISTTGLVLGLGFPSSSTTADNQNSRKPSIKMEQFAKDYPASDFEPSLTLSLFGETSDKVAEKLDADHLKASNDPAPLQPPTDDLRRQDSAASSFSNVSVKREREFGGDDVEIERISSRVSDEDDDGANARKKLRLTKAQSALLEESFKQHSTLNPVIHLSLPL